MPSSSETPTAGVVTKVSPYPVDATVRRLEQILADRNLQLFAVIDHSGEAARVGLTMPDTKLVIFGSPAGGTQIMIEAPLAALDLPMKLLVWEDADGVVSVSYNAPVYLAERHHLSDDLRARLDGIDAISTAVVGAAP